MSILSDQNPGINIVKYLTWNHYYVTGEYHGTFLIPSGQRGRGVVGPPAGLVGWAVLRRGGGAAPWLEVVRDPLHNYHRT